MADKGSSPVTGVGRSRFQYNQTAQQLASNVDETGSIKESKNKPNVKQYDLTKIANSGMTDAQKYEIARNIVDESGGDWSTRSEYKSAIDDVYSKMNPKVEGSDLRGDIGVFDTWQNALDTVYGGIGEGFDNLVDLYGQAYGKLTGNTEKAKEIIDSTTGDSFAFIPETVVDMIPGLGLVNSIPRSVNNLRGAFSGVDPTTRQKLSGLDRLEKLAWGVADPVLSILPGAGVAKGITKSGVDAMRLARTGGKSFDEIAKGLVAKQPKPNVAGNLSDLSAKAGRGEEMFDREADILSRYRDAMKPGSKIDADKVKALDEEMKTLGSKVEEDMIADEAKRLEGEFNSQIEGLDSAVNSSNPFAGFGTMNEAIAEGALTRPFRARAQAVKATPGIFGKTVAALTGQAPGEYISGRLARRLAEKGVTGKGSGRVGKDLIDRMAASKEEMEAAVASAKEGAKGVEQLKKGADAATASNWVKNAPQEAEELAQLYIDAFKSGEAARTPMNFLRAVRDVSRRGGARTLPKGIKAKKAGESRGLVKNFVINPLIGGLAMSAENPGYDPLTLLDEWRNSGDPAAWLPMAMAVMPGSKRWARRNLFAGNASPYYATKARLLANGLYNSSAGAPTSVDPDSQKLLEAIIANPNNVVGTQTSKDKEE